MKPIEVCASAERILILKTNFLGDVLNFLPVANFLRKASKAGICWLVTKPGYPVVAELADADEILLLDDAYLYNYGNLLDIASWLREKRFDLLVTSYQEECFLISLLALLSRTPERVGYNLLNRGWFFNIVVPKSDSERRVEINAQIIKTLGGAGHKDYLYVPKATVPGAERFAARLQAEFGVSPKDNLCVLHLYSPKPTKSFLMEYADELIARVKAELGMTPVLIGSEAEVRRFGEERKKLGLVNLAGQLSLLELYYLLKQAGLFIGIDSFPMQLTEFAGVKAVTLFGSTEIGENRVPFAGTVRAEVKCAPCWPRKTECDQGLACWRELKPELIIRAAKEL